MVEIKINNCNSIDKANIRIEKNKLNVKYGINGTGKTTIAKAILEHDTDNLIDLLPFKYRDENPDDIKPIVENADEFTNLLMFNEEYINQFVYLEDELLKNSFEIFIKDEKYDENILAVEELFSDVKNIFQSDEILLKIIDDLKKLSTSFSKTSGGMAKNSQMHKALGNGNKLVNIPEGLEEYSEYLASDDNTKWIKWQSSGNSFLEISDKCPYCTSSVVTKKDTILKVAVEYKDKDIEFLIKIIDTMKNLKEYFIPESQATIESITKNNNGLSEDENSFLKTIKIEIDRLLQKFESLKELTISTFKDVDDMAEKINGLKINLSLVPSLNSTITQEITNPLNISLDTLIEKAKELKGKITKQKNSVATKIEKHKDDINIFLKYAGYKYTIEIEETDAEYKMRLQHIELTKLITNGNQHLSYGEKNAFALMLFMYDCLSKESDLIILDDPISSFDKNKKFAIIERLFRGENSFKGKTVLMLTHDIDPIIDIFKVLYRKIEPVPVASFLKSRDGIIEELSISRDNLQTFAQVCIENIASSSENINKLIYLRRYYEVLDDKSEAYQLLANLFHKRVPPTKFVDNDEIEMTQDEIDIAENAIKKEIPEFNYDEQILIFKDEEVLRVMYNACQSGYEKLQLFRIIHEGRYPSDVIQKFINETYHIENEYISQLNPRKYEMVPEFIIQECDNAMDNS
ncbi:MAG: hypothetical protein DRG78_03315 [Epsilonproteobacteria bacterium]|nr:MAG: hypothetical protein DRG78_03315 [Campylobacterota bacterium]